MVGFIAGRTAPPGRRMGHAGRDHLRRQGRRRGQDRGDGGRGHPRVALAGGARRNPARGAERRLSAAILTSKGGPRSAPSSEAPRAAPGKADDMADDAGLINEVLAETSFLYGGNAAFVEDLYAKWAADPNSVEPSWRAFFASLHDRADDVKRAAAEPAWTPSRRARRPARLAVGHRRPVARGRGQARPRSPSASSAPAATRRRGPRRHAGFPARHHDDPRLPDARPPEGQPRPAGHRHARRATPPSSTRPPTASPRPTTTGRSSSTSCWGWRPRRSARSWRSCAAPTAATSACSTCTSPTRKEKAWLQERIEGRDKEIVFTKEGKVAILKKLIETEGFERFLHRASPAPSASAWTAARAMVPALEQIIKRGGALGVKDIVIGMPHRGRLNVLAAVMGKPYQVIFHEFQGGSSLPSRRRGLGRREVPPGRLVGPRVRRQQRPPVADRQPLHLEIVNPVVIGKARAKQAFTLRETPGRRPRPRAAAADARRRGLRRPGRGGRVLRALGPAAATASAAPCTSSSTTRSASPPARRTAAPRPIRPTWR